MSYKKQRSRIIYWVCLAVYTLVLGAAAVFALTLVWDFAELYEESMPEKVIDQYVAQLSGDLWEQGLAETMSAMEHEFQTDEECREVVLEMLNGDINYVRTTSTDPSLNAYALRCGGSSFGKVYLVKDDTKQANFEVLGKELSLPWDLRPWLVYKQEFDLTGLYTSVEVTVPSSYTVQINGKALTEEYITETGIRFDSLEQFYSVNPNLPTKCTYRADNIIGQLTPVILDENGSEHVIDTSRDDSQFIKPCTEDKLARLDQFCSKFVEHYHRYTSGIMGKNSGNGYATLTAYVQPGSDLDKRLYDSLDGLSWAHTSAFRLDSYELVGATDLGEGFYVCDVVTNTTSITQGSGEKQDENHLKIIVVEKDGDIRALALA